MQSSGVALVENPGTSAQSMEPYRDLHTIKEEAFTKIREYMGIHGFTPSKIDDAIIAVGELITNVGKHAYDGDNHCQAIVELGITDSYIKIVVTDFGKGEIIEPTTIDLMDENGFGLYIAMQVAEIVFLSKVTGFHSVQAIIRK